MNILLTNNIANMLCKYTTSTPRLTTYSIVNVIATVLNTRNDKHMCSKGVKYCKNSEISCFRLLEIINPIRFLVVAVMLCTLSCGYSRCTECHAIYFKPMVLPFLSPSLIIIVA